MKSKKYYFFTLLCISLLLTIGCKKDLGNYTYTELNTLVDIPELNERKEATVGKQFVIDPVIIFSKDPSFDESKYEYEWGYTGPNGLGGEKLFLLGNAKKLDILMTLVSGTYDAYFSVTDISSSVKYTKQFKLKVTNELNEGWIMMNEAGGKARVDMLSLNADGNFILVNDLLKTTGSELQLEGKPVMIYNYSTGLLIGPDKISHGLYLSTDKKTTKIEPNTFKWTPTMGLEYEMFGDIPTGFYAEVMQQRSGSTAYMIGDGNAYFYNRTSNTYFSTPISYITEEERSFKVAPFVGGDHSIVGNAHAIFYDKTNRRFVKHSAQNGTCTTVPEPPEDQKLFSFRTGMDMEYMRWVSFNGGEVFSILKEPSGNRKYLARFNSANNVQSYYSEIVGTEISLAEHYAISPEFGYIFYTVGSKVYEYDMIYKSSKLMKDYGSQKISYLNFYEFKGKTKYKDSNKLMVGIYDPSKSDGTEGSLDIYTVPGLNGDLVLYKTFNGFGRIKSLTYRER